MDRCPSVRLTPEGSNYIGDNSITKNLTIRALGCVPLQPRRQPSCSLPLNRPVLIVSAISFDSSRYQLRSSNWIAG